MILDLEAGPYYAESTPKKKKKRKPPIVDWMHVENEDSELVSLRTRTNAF